MSELRTVKWNNRPIEYMLIRKPVKNINMRIKSDGTIQVSANRSVRVKYIDDFIISKGSYIIKALQQMKERCRNTAEPKQYTIAEQEVLHQMCREIYPKFSKFNLSYPEVKIRYMTSRWGSCRPWKNSITLNSRLIDAPRESAEYVVLHEFVHFIHPNHSKQFYDLVSELMPDWRKRKEGLK
ncbi:MAG: M48 family metallopeptidase [Lachnospiraceae bacterium]